MPEDAAKGAFMRRKHLRKLGNSSLNLAPTMGLASLCVVTLLGCGAPEPSPPAVIETATASPVVPTPEATANSEASEFFPGRHEVSISELFAAMSAQADALSASSVVRGEYDALLKKHGLQGDDALYADFLRVRLAFEATRAGGWWGLRWRVTDMEPNSEAVWSQWRASTSTRAMQGPTTAIAECDELSALFAVVTHGLGLSKRSRVGLFWPTSNHTVAVWTIDDASGKERARIVVPTSQIFLDGAQSLGTDGFDPWRQPKVYDYRRRDIAKTETLPAPLVRYFLAQNARYGALSRGELQTFRNLRESEQRRSPVRQMSPTDVVR
jgi:hypothetical protein